MRTVAKVIQHSIQHRRPAGSRGFSPLPVRFAFIQEDGLKQLTASETSSVLSLQALQRFI